MNPEELYEYFVRLAVNRMLNRLNWISRRILTQLSMSFLISSLKQYSIIKVTKRLKMANKSRMKIQNALYARKTSKTVRL